MSKCEYVRAIAAVLSLAALRAQPAVESSKRAAELARYLAYDADKPNKAFSDAGILGCGGRSASIAATIELIALQDLALPAIQKVLESGPPQDSFWVGKAYAAIRGVAGVEYLRRLARSQRGGDNAGNFDAAIALSLGMTSYVSTTRPTGRTINCLRAAEPRDALDLIILGWQKNDQMVLEDGSSAKVRAMLRKLRATSWWHQTRASLMRAQSDHNAVGYRFDIPGRLSDPAPELRGLSHDVEEGPKLDMKKFGVVTIFATSQGRECGRLEVTFITEDPSTLATRYLVDSKNIQELLEVISRCSMSP